MSTAVARRAVDAELTTSAPLAGGLPALYGEPQPSRRAGAVPPVRAELWLRKYETGGGRSGRETVLREKLGVSEGVPGQRFRLDRRPLLRLPGNEQHVLEVVVDGRIEEWHEVPSFADAKEEQQCFVLDYTAGEVVFGPAVLEQTDATSFVWRFTDALDEVLAPVLATLDNLPAYFDPKTAPEYLLDWLAGWVGLELFEKWPPKLRRALVADAVERHRQRGTKLGLQSLVALFAEVEAEQVTIEESGGVWGLAVVALDDDRPPEFPTPGTGSWMKISVALGEKRLADEGVSVEQIVRRVAERVGPAHVALTGVVVSA